MAIYTIQGIRTLDLPRHTFFDPPTQSPPRMREQELGQRSRIRICHVCHKSLHWENIMRHVWAPRSDWHWIHGILCPDPSLAYVGEILS